MLKCRISRLILFVLVVFAFQKPLSLYSEHINGFADNKGVKIHYFGEQMDSKAPTLVFIPGITMPGWIWEKQLKYFSDHYSVIAIDPRSQGESTQTTDGQYHESRASDIKAVVDQLHLKKVILIGWSLGVGEVISYVHQYGTDNVAGIVLVDGFAGFDPGSIMFNMMVDYWSQFQIDRPVKNRNFVTGMFKHQQDDDYINRLNESTLRMPTTTMMALIYNFILRDQRSFLSEINVPALIVGINAPWLDNMKEIQRLIPNSQLAVIEDANHAAFVDQPEKFNMALEKFISNIPLR